MSTTGNELEISYVRISQSIELEMKESPKRKYINILQYLLPIFLILVLGLIFYLNVLTFGFTIEGLIFHLIVPISIYFIITIIGSLIIKKFTNKVKTYSDNNPKEIKLLISDKGINLDATISDSVLEWRFITEVIETEHLLWFKSHYPALSMISIPKIVIDEKKRVILDQILIEQFGGIKMEQINHGKLVGKNNTGK